MSEGDITEVDIFLDDIPVEIDLRTHPMTLCVPTLADCAVGKVSHVPTDVVADDSQGESELRSSVRGASRHYPAPLML